MLKRRFSEPATIELDGSGNGFSREFCQEDSVCWDSLYLNLIDANILPLETEMSSYRELSPWKRGGAETYYCVIEIGLFENSTSIKPFAMQIVVKALVSSATESSAQALNWYQKAEHLENSGIPTGVLGVYKGCIYQRYLPETVTSRLLSYTHHSSCFSELESLLRELFAFAYRVKKAGFYPLSLLPDLRIIDSDIALVDLGSDLGQSYPQNGVCPKELLQKEFQKFCLHNLLKTLLPMEFVRENMSPL